MPNVKGRAGVLAPLVTPFSSSGAVELGAFRANHEACTEAGCVGVLVCGSNGEAVTLERDEKLALVRSARQQPGVVLVGTGLEGTRATISLTKEVADLGADAALVLTPHFFKNRMTADTLRRYYEAVADASPIPILAYSMPAFTGLTFPTGLAVTLAQHPNILGMKDSSGDIGALARTVAAAPESFWLASGSASTFYAALCVGAQAGILAVACCAPGAAVALHAAFVRGDHAEALRWQRRILPLADALSSHGVPGLKAAVDSAQLTGGGVRAPLAGVSDDVREEIALRLRELTDAI